MLSGRLRVYVRGVVEPIAEVGQGQPVGEMGFLSGVARTATVVALRDSRLLAITREQFRKVSAACPNIPGTVITSLARRLSASSQTAAGMATPVRTVAILSAGGSAPPYEFI